MQTSIKREESAKPLIEPCGIRFVGDEAELYAFSDSRFCWVRIRHATRSKRSKTLPMEAVKTFDGWVTIDMTELKRLLDQGPRDPDTELQTFVAPINAEIESVRLAKRRRRKSTKS